MSGRRWRRAVYELKRSIEQLGSEQSFCVLLFDGRARPMCGLGSEDLTLWAANASNRKRFVGWVSGQATGPFTRPKQALAYALQLQPDAVFLLSDGEFMDDSERFLRLYNRPAPDDESDRESDVEEEGSEGQRASEPPGQRLAPRAIPIHTICFESKLGLETLQRIAVEHEGTFRFVP
jgi:hypothetical protein